MITFNNGDQESRYQNALRQLEQAKQSHKQSEQLSQELQQEWQAFDLVSLLAALHASEEPSA